MNYAQAYQPPPNQQPANFRNPNQGSPIVKYILIAGAVLLALLIIATAIVFILSRTYSDDGNKNNETAEIEEETDTNKPPETGIPEDALRASLLDVGIGCNYMDRGFLINLFLSETDEFDKNDYKTQTDDFKGPVFICEDTKNTDLTYFRYTPEDWKVFQEVIIGAVIKDKEDEGIEGGGIAATKEVCADPIQAQALQQGFEEGSDGIFNNAVAIEGWVFFFAGDTSSTSLENKLTEAGIQTKSAETVSICEVLLN